MLLYKSHYLTVNQIEIRYLMHLQWTVPADKLDEVGIYAETGKFMQNRIRRRARLILWDFSVIENRVSQQFFTWIEQNILPQIISVKTKRIAYVLKDPQKFQFPGDSMEFNGRQAEFRIFPTQQEAMNWLMEVAEMKELGRSSHHHHNH